MEMSTMHMNDQAPSLYCTIGQIEKSTLWSFVSIALYKVMLDVSYFYLISPIWSYAKFELNLNSIKLAESYFLLFVVFLLMPKSSKKLSDVFVWLLILFSYIPMLTLFALKDETRIFMYAVTGFWLLVFFLLQMSWVSLPLFKQSALLRFSLFALLSIIVYLMIYKYLGFSFTIDIRKVYEIRSQFSETAIPLAGYLFTWLAYIVNPLFFAFFCVKRKWIFVVLIVFLEFLLFSQTGNKTFLFALPFMLILIWIITRKNPLAYTAIVLSGGIVLGIFSYWVIDDIWISSLFTRRSLFVPAQLSFFYNDFFSKNECVFLSHSIFSSFSDYPYHLVPPNLIGDIYLGDPGCSANTGIVGDAYMNFGYAGLFLWAVLFAVIVKLLDTFTSGKDIRIAIGGIAMPVITLMNSALLTNLLTHGLLLSLLLLYLLPENDVLVKSDHKNFHSEFSSFPHPEERSIS